MAAVGRHPAAEGEPAVITTTGATVEAAAEAGDVAERTVYRRLDDPDYRDAIGGYREAALGRAFGVLSAGVAELTAALLGLVRNAESESVRFGAMRAALEHAVRLHEHLDVSARLAAMEREIATIKADRNERERRQAAGYLPSVGRTA